ncbi:MAG: hypothetical protein JWL77_648 [Chthonomonadaceae bacterium]|nr:hypothetical protein [Chthonomonadaceae bacterium]
MKRIRLGIALLTLVCTAGAVTLLVRRAAAEHFEIALRADAGRQLVEAAADTTPPIGGVNARPVLRLKAGDPVHISWKLKSNFPHGTMKGVTIHFFVVREKEIGQKPVPDPSGPAGVLDNKLTMDFSPTGVSSGALTIVPPGSGNYLVRVQSEDTHDEHDHEHFSAVDIVVP